MFLDFKVLFKVPTDELTLPTFMASVLLSIVSLYCFLVMILSASNSVGVKLFP